MKPLFIIGSLLCMFTACKEVPKAAETSTEVMPTLAIEDLFEPVDVAKMHMFSIGDPSADAEYPYMGKLIPEQQYGSLSPDLTENAKALGEGIYAIYHLEKHGYLLRIPGKYASNALAYCTYDATNNLLAKAWDVASLDCDEGYCNQLDAWFEDLDSDKKLELIIRERVIDNGKASEASMAVYTLDASGNFVAGKQELTNSTSYVMYEN